MSSYRPERVAEQIHKEITHLLMNRIKDPRVASVTITGVQLTRDLRLARVYFTVVDEQDELKAAQQGLKSASAFIRRELAQLMRLRFIPELRFEYDSSVSYGQKIDSLLQQVQDDLNDDSADH